MGYTRREVVFHIRCSVLSIPMLCLREDNTYVVHCYVSTTLATRAHYVHTCLGTWCGVVCVWLQCTWYYASSCCVYSVATDLAAVLCTVCSYGVGEEVEVT